MASWHAEPISKKHDRDAFDCGDEALNDFLREIDLASLQDFDGVFSRAAGTSVGLEATDAVGREFWRKIDNGESFTDKEVLDALSINRRGSRRTARGVVAPADFAGLGVAPVEWQGDLASFGAYSSRASWDGDNFNVFFVPDALAKGADLNDEARVFGARTLSEACGMAGGV